MSDPKRLLDEGDGLESLLLSSAMEDRPRAGLSRKVHVALGVSGAAISAGTATSTAAAASKMAPLLASMGVAKWAGVLAIGASTIVGGAVVRRALTPETHVTVSARAATPARSPAPTTVSAAPASAPAIAAPPPLPEPIAEPVAAFAQVPVAPAPKAAPLPAPKPAAPRMELAGELALLDRAHTALEQDDARAALAALDRHDLDYPGGDLAPEALSLRVQAYARRHDDPKVTELGARFLAAYPDDPQASRVQALVRASSGRAP